MILVVLVLLFFLGLKNASFVGLAIPLSMLLGVLILDLTGTTMNVVVLFSLILALGLLVDNGIVVIENVYRYMQEGYDSATAARLGTGEVAVPIIVSTLTTLAAFVPLAFWPGLVGEFFKYMPITLIIVLTSSLFVALVINPVFTAAFMSVDEQASSKDARVGRPSATALSRVGCYSRCAVVGALIGSDTMRNFFGIALVVQVLYFWVLRPASFAFQNSFLPWLERAYDGFVNWALRYAWLVFGGTVAALVGELRDLRGEPPAHGVLPDGRPALRQRLRRPPPRLRHPGHRPDSSTGSRSRSPAPSSPTHPSSRTSSRRSARTPPIRPARPNPA